MKNTKKTRRVAAFAAAVMMAACVAVPMSSFSASAEGETVTVTVNESEENHAFSAYQIFSGDVDNNGALSGIAWGSGIDSDKLTDLYNALNALDIKVDSTDVFEDLSDPVGVANAISKLSNGEAAAYGDLDKVATVFQKYLSASSTPFSYDGTAKKYTATLANGYYLVVDSKGTGTTSVTAISKYLLNIVGDSTLTIEVKKDSPEVMKKIKENVKYTATPTFKTVSQAADTGYNDTADYCIGDSVPFKLYGSLPSTLDNYQNGYKYVFHDSLDTQFTAPTAMTAVKVGNYYVKAVTTETDKTGYYLKKPGTESGSPCTFEISFADIKSVVLYTDEKCTQVATDSKVQATDIVTVEYEAVLNNTAEIGRPGQQNEVYLEYANDSNWNGEGTPSTTNTPEDNVIAFTYELDLTKVDSVNQKKTLSGASFVLERTVDGVTQYAVLDTDGQTIKNWVTTDGTVSVDTTAGTISTSSTWKAVNTTTETNLAPTVVTTPENGVFKYIGLDDGTYVAHEIKAPTSYKIPTTGQTFTFVVSANTTNGQNGEGVDATGTALASLKLYKDSVSEGNLLDTSTDTDADEKFGIVDTKITNTSSSSLPSTGGIGTTLFYVGGGVLVAGAGVLLITKKRAKKDAE